ncbi:unnamed protein product [Hymenolepis diminuta]|nr:unnamed protein product [Hymenolepis diminuta]
MALIYVHFEFRKESQVEPIKEIVNRYIAEKKLLLEKPSSVDLFKPLERCLVSVDSEYVDEFIRELEQNPVIAVKKHASD